MKKFINNILILLFIVLINSCIQSEPKMIDIERLLIAYGYDDGIFTGTKDILTTEEFITSGYFWPMFAWEEEVVAEEVPYNKEGLLRITCMWQFKAATDPDNKQKYFDRIQNIKESATKGRLFKSSKKTIEIEGVNVTNVEINNYYEKAITNKIRDIKNEFISSSENEFKTDFLIIYCQEPTSQNLITLQNYYQQLKKENQTHASIYLEFLKALSPEIADMVSNNKKIYEDGETE